MTSEPMRSSRDVSATPRTLKMMCCAPSSGEPAEPVDDRIGLLLVQVHGGQHGPLDLVVGPAQAFAMLPQDVELGSDELGRATEDVARVCVLGHQPQRLSLPATADEDRDPRAADRLRGIDGVGGHKMRARELAVRAAPLGPHLVGEAKGVLQPFEPILQRGEVEAEALRQDVHAARSRSTRVRPTGRRGWSWP